MMYRDHGLILFVSSLLSSSSWSLTLLSCGGRPVQDNLDRRDFFATIGLVTTGIMCGPFSQPEWAYAMEQPSGLPASFDIYNIIPDASETLNPKLVKVDVSLTSRQLVGSTVT